MTFPALVDTPDYQGYAQWRSKNLFPAGPRTLVPGETYTDYIAMQSWQTVFVRVVPTAGYGTVKIYWYADSAGTEYIGSDAWNVTANTGLSIMLPCEGMYLVIGIDVTSATDMTCKTYAYGCNNAVNKLYYPIDSTDVWYTNQVIPASGNAKQNLAWIDPGSAHLWFDPSDTSGKLDVAVEGLNADGTASLIVTRVQGATAAFDSNFILPPMPIQLVITNNDTANPHTCSYSLIRAG